MITCTVGVINDKKFIIFTYIFPLPKSVLPQSTLAPNCIQIPQADWPEVVVISAPYERQNIEVHIFQRANRSGFATWEFPAKLKSTKIGISS